MNKKLFALIAALIITQFISGTLYADENQSGEIYPAEKTYGAEDESEYPVLPEYILLKKREGWYPGVLPIYNYTSENGHGIGVRGAVFQNGNKDEKYFDRSPYFYRITGQVYSTTLGWQYHFVDADIPFVMGTPFRLKTGFVYENTANANFFGIGPEKTDRLTDRNGNRYSSYEDYYKNFLISPAGDPVNYKYNKYGITRPRFYMNGYRNITRSFKAMAGLEIRNTTIDPWGGRTFSIEDEKQAVDAAHVTSAATRIEEAGLADQDGWMNTITLGAGYDTRDYEPDPRTGMFIDCTFNSSMKAIGSDFNYTRSTIGARFFISPVSLRYTGSASPLFKFIPTLALRTVYTTTTGDIPFHALGNFIFMYDNQKALGGSRTIRAYMDNRFIGRTMTNANIELRMEFIEFTALGNLFTFKALVFADTGSAFNNAADPLTDFSYYHHAYGGGLAMGWNQSLIIHFYYGLSREDSAVSIDIGHAI